MPTVLRAEGFEVVIRTDDHEPGHVHVFHTGIQVVIELDKLRVRGRTRMPDRSVAKALRLVAMHREYLISQWRMLHG